MQEDKNLQPYYRASRKQLIKIYSLCGLSLIFFAVMAFLAYSAFFRMHMDGNPEVLADFGDRLGLSLFIISIGLTFPVGMGIYMGCYVGRADFSPQYGVMVFRTLNPIGKRIWIDGEGAANFTYHDGKLDLMGDLRNPDIIVPTVDAPWLSSKIEGKRFPLIIDVKGVFYDE